MGRIVRQSAEDARFVEEIGLEAPAASIPAATVDTVVAEVGAGGQQQASPLSLTTVTLTATDGGSLTR